MGGFAWVTLATNDSYSLGALVLAHSLRRVGTKHDLAVLVTPGVTSTMREKLASVFSLVQEVNVLDSKDEANLALLARPELGITFTKLHCWRLTQYDKCVFVDADTLVIRNCDELFEREELSAAPDVGWPDCFNSGVFVFTPSQQTFASITAYAAAKGSFDGGDQGLLNQYFSDWAHKDISKHLPFIYNMCSTATYSYLPAFKEFGDDVRIIHFIGIAKPWLQNFDTLTGQVQPASGTNHLQPLLQLWWNIFCENVHPQLSPIMASSTLASVCHELNTFTSTPSYAPTIYDHDNIEIDFSEFRDPWEDYNEDSNISNTDDCPTHDFYHQQNNENLSNQSISYDNEYHSQIAHSSDEKRDQYIDRLVLDSRQEYQMPSQTDYSNDHHHHEEKYQTQNTSQIYLESHDSPQSQNHLDEHKLVHDCYDNSSEKLDKVWDESFQHKVENEESFLPAQSTVNFTVESTYYDHPTHDSSKNTGRSDHVNTEEQANSSDIQCQQKRIPEELHKTKYENSDVCKKQTDVRTQKSHSYPAPCTNSKSIATQSEPNIAGQLECNDAGIAGALAKITLGEARSPEQFAFEEHMRKQSWEQGQIDYMGRDSFENIWKKISETLNVPQLKRQPSPPKQTKAVLPKSEKPEVKVEPTVATDDESVAKSEAAALSESLEKEVQNLILEFAPEPTKIIAPCAQSSNSDAAAALVPSLSPLLNPESVDLTIQKNDNLSSLLPATITPNDPFIPQIREMPLTDVKHTESSITDYPGSAVVVSVEATTPESQKDVERSPIQLEESTSSEIVPDSPVPIQVAESVLEADVKESVTEDLRPVTEEVISSISVSAQESVPAVLETALEADASAVTPTPNGSAVSEPSYEIGNGIDIANLSFSSPVPVTSTTLAIAEIAPEVVASVRPEQVTPVAPEIEACPLPARLIEPEVNVSAIIQQTSQLEEDSVEKLEELPGIEPSRVPQTSEVSSEILLAQQSEIPVETVEKPREEQILAETEQSSLPNVEDQKTEEFIECPIKSERKALDTKLMLKTYEIPVPVEDPAIDSSQREESIDNEKVLKDAKMEAFDEVASQSESSGESPVRPSRTKDLPIPGTPIVTEATPPTSPPIGAVETFGEQSSKSTKRVVKKVVKKTSSDTAKPVEGTETTDSEGKKVTKKVVKKVVKKTKGDEATAECSGGNEKPPKKIVKVVKKTTKSPQTSLETDTTLPETPPPGVSEIPVPPKRKVKTTIGKTTNAKVDSEP